MVTSGAWGSLNSIINAYIGPGDKALLVEPFFDCYAPQIQAVGGTSVGVPLRLVDDEFVLDIAELEQIIVEHRPKMLLWNAPHNPTGKVFSVQETAAVAELCVKYDIMVLSDEVHLPYPLVSE